MVTEPSRDAQTMKEPVLYVRHLEPPLHYPQLARQVPVQGTVINKVTVGADGLVLGAKSRTRAEDPLASHSSRPREGTGKLVKKRVCANGPPVATCGAR